MAELGRLRKNDTTEIVVQKTEFRGSVGIDIREYVTSDRYTGWSKNVDKDSCRDVAEFQRNPGKSGCGQEGIAPKDDFENRMVMSASIPMPGLSRTIPDRPPTACK